VNYRAVVLDVDGTLVDSNAAHAAAWVDALAASGRHVDVSRVRPLIGMGSDKLLPRVSNIDADSPEGQAIAVRRGDIFRRTYLPHLQPTRGAHQLLEWLRDERLTLVVASSADPGELHSLLDIAGATKLVESKTSSDDVENSKPDPDVVRAALARTGCEVQDVIMIGDTPYDVEAALRAGIGIIGLRSGGLTDADLKGALAVYDDPQDLLDHYDLSPFKRRLPVRSA
jgi:HAD superfamily hydrolase (TIGR01509 family)